MGRNVYSVLRPLDLALLLFQRFVDLVNGSRLTLDAVLDAFIDIDGRLDAHQRPNDVDREDQATLVVHG